MEKAGVACCDGENGARARIYKHVLPKHSVKKEAFVFLAYPKVIAVVVFADLVGDGRVPFGRFAYPALADEALALVHAAVEVELTELCHILGYGEGILDVDECVEMITKKLGGAR